jgi:hypothetical protein
MKAWRVVGVMLRRESWGPAGPCQASNGDRHAGDFIANFICTNTQPSLDQYTRRHHESHRILGL